jgi:hypothetical protein
MTTIQDLTAKGLSSCCSSKVSITGVCFECKEHCDAIDENEEDKTMRPAYMDR